MLSPLRKASIRYVEAQQLTLVFTQNHPMPPNSYQTLNDHLIICQRRVISCLAKHDILCLSLHSLPCHLQLNDSKSIEIKIVRSTAVEVRRRWFATLSCFPRRWHRFAASLTDTPQSGSLHLFSLTSNLIFF